jgi:hypothetical protein
MCLTIEVRLEFFDNPKVVVSLADDSVGLIYPIVVPDFEQDIYFARNRLFSTVVENDRRTRYCLSRHGTSSSALID